MKSKNTTNGQTVGGGVSASNERLVRILQATSEQLDRIDQVLAGQLPTPPPAPLTGPLLMGMSAAARFLGISRVTIWRMVKAGRLEKVEMLPGSHRLRRSDVEAIVARK